MSTPPPKAPVAAPQSRVIIPDVIYTAVEAAALVACSPDQMMRQLRARKIKGSRAFGGWRVRGSDLLNACR